MPKNLKSSNKFPDGFMFGTSTAAYQIEGAWNEDGKGENIWDKMVHTHPELIKDSANGDVACDSYHKYKEDVALAKALNLKFYRFSISWTRITPTGEAHKINPKGIEYYNRLIDELLANNIEPLVTMYHWDLPQYLQDLGGWVNPIIADYFKEYAKVLFSNFGDRVKWWITINEPMETCKGYSFCNYAPYLNLSNTGYYRAGHTQLLAHSKVYHLYNDMFREKQKGKISISINGMFFIPKNVDSEKDIETAERANQFERGWFSHPIYKGDYPPVMREWVDRKCKSEGRPWSTLPTFSEEEIKLLKGTADFYALNHYSTRFVTNGIDPNPNPNYNPDAEYIISVDKSWPVSIAPWLIVVPEGLHKLLVWIKNEYNNPPIIITENGYADDGRLNDLERIDYIKSHLYATLQAINDDKCNVIGYTCWSLLDNFEWMDGYRYHFGLVNIDFNNPQRPRVPKASYQFFKAIVTTGILNDSVSPTS
ncbi:myrosinase 1-like [Daktulosphaira vitifoliae]|uniref:myrosinase 1-like n=1 Tax=Daktulosphaira vitifoliae TaxID=58002 RepID=UPI0021AAD78A|nr:myrosinase 1-like [Daktulosphaira vitifoliae]XP_050546384.1 myrosinase 1-like [Daktulosphaira vitifoliae]XP_050546385.1 myrosinase 1-like [Daktulosphaira vitifoliae]